MTWPPDELIALDEKAQHIADFLKQVFTISDPSEARGETVTACELLERGAGELKTELAGNTPTRSRRGRQNPSRNACQSTQRGFLL